jgi:hypothetical protein
MSKHQNLPWNWRWTMEYDWDMSMAPQLVKFGWSIKDHSEDRISANSE